MTPRKSQQGASAAARKAPVHRRARDASSSRTPTSALTAKQLSAAVNVPAGKRVPAPSRLSSGKKPASSKRPTSGKTNSAPARTGASKRKGKDASWFRWWLLPPLVGATIAVLVALYYPVAQVQYKETRERAELQAELKGLQTRNSRLAVEVARLKTNEGVEDYARSQLGMVKRGEHVVIVTDSAGGRSAPTTTTEARIDAPEQTATAPKGAWTEFLDAVFGVQ